MKYTVDSETFYGKMECVFRVAFQYSRLWILGHRVCFPDPCLLSGKNSAFPVTSAVGKELISVLIVPKM